jgi:SAM-dependent methyltransferase
MNSTGSETAGDSSRPWPSLSSGFEQARAREDSLDRLVEWPAQRALLGDVTGLAVLDAGCGNGAKIAQLASEGAGASVGVDISGNFITPPPGVELIEGDLSDLAAVPGSPAGGSTESSSCSPSGTPRTRSWPYGSRARC